MKKLLALSAILIFSACLARRPEPSLTSEPSIERAFDLLNTLEEGRDLVRFLLKNPVRFEYSNTPGLCHKFALQRGYIYLPEDYRGSDLVVALAVGRAAYIYKLYLDSGLEEIISEEEELGALFQARLGVAMNLRSEEFEKAGSARAIRNTFCTYLLENSRYAMSQARAQALAPDAACQRPLETLQNQRVWLEKTREAINDQTFYQLLHERDLARVRKGSMTMAEAMKRDARVRGLPTYEVYRFQRTFYDRQNEIFDRFMKIYRSEIAADAAWRERHQLDIERTRYEFSDCNLP